MGNNASTRATWPPARDRRRLGVWSSDRMTTPSSHAWFDGLPDRYIVAHRGAAGHRPENTIESFQHALELGADVLEMDVHLTADDHLVITHDPTVARVTDGRDPVRAITLQTLQSFDAGYRFTGDRGVSYPWRDQGVRIPTLQKVLDAFPDTRLVVEIKPNDPVVTAALAEMLGKRDLRHRVLVGSFHDAVLADFRARDIGYATAAGQTESKRFVLRAYAGLAQHLDVPYEALIVSRTYRRMPVVTRRVVRQAHARGLHVQVWTVNDPVVMRKLYALGANALTTDYPDRAREVLAEQKLRMFNAQR